jgi:hypothetical protein
MAETPKAEARTLKQGTVGERLGHINSILLPKEICKDPNAQWVLAHDQHSEPDERSELGPEQIAYNAAEQAITSLLQERLPFYLAILFHIGRQWKISESLGNDARRLRDKKNLIASGENLIAFAKQAGRSLDPKLAQQSVVALSKVATEQHDEALALARNWWDIWTDEVGDLRKIVLAFKEQAPRDRDGRDYGRIEWLNTFAMFLFFQQRPSRIRFALREKGVQFREGAEEWPQTSTALITAPIVFGIAGLATQYMPHRLERFFGDWQYLFHEHMRLVRRIEIEPAIRDAEARLHERYGDRNPFDEFAVGKKAASERLVTLLKENELVDEEPSRWRKEWEATLESTSGFTQVPPAKEALIPARVERAVLSADSAIKSEILGSRTPIETFSEFCQRMFEQDWVREVANSVFRRPKDSEDARSHNDWELSDFEALLLEIVRGLNAIGYHLGMPAQERLKNLVTKAQEGEPIWGDW